MRTDAMNFPAIASLQKRQRFLRSVAAVVVVTFTTLILEPAAVAARVAVEDAQQQAANVPSSERRLSQSIEKIDEKLAKLRSKLAQKLDTKVEREELTNLRKIVEKLDKQIAKNFDDIAKHIKSKGLGETILKRHTDAVARYRSELAALIRNLTSIEAATNDDDRENKITATVNHLIGKKHKRSQQPFDPNDLPHGPLAPNKDNKPKTKKDEFTHSGLFNTPYPKFAALGDFTFDKLPGANDPAYLSESVEITLTPAIHDKAAELNHDPVAIYRWVRNNVEWQPTWGAMQNADLTLSSLRGNAMDIASLTIALLRASGIPARYVHGTIDVPIAKFLNWVGDFENPSAGLDFAASGGIPISSVTGAGKIIKARLEHVWVEAAIDYKPSRGAKNRDADTWVALDPSFKQYQYLEGLDAVAISGIDANALAQSFVASGIVNEQEGWVSGFDASILQNAQSQAQVALEQHITNTLPNPTVGDVIGGRRTIIEEYPVLPSALPNTITVEGARYHAIPDALQHKIAFSFNSDTFGLVGGIEYPWARVNNEKVTISFNPATPEDEAALLSLLPEGPITDISQLPSSIPSYLIQVIPELKLNDEVVLSGNPMALGEEVNFAFSVTMPTYGTKVHRSPVVAGSYLAVAVAGGSVAPQRLNALQARIDSTKTTLESGDATAIGALTREHLLGDMFYAGTLSYFAQYTVLGQIAGLQQNARVLLMPSGGTYGYEPNVNYFFGFPRAIEAGGVVMDLDRVATAVGTSAGNRQQQYNFVLQMGMMSSALEHAVSEQIFTGPEYKVNAVSTVKAFSIAAATNQRFFHITPSNQNNTLQYINHRSETMSEIRGALAIGKEVITHPNAISVQKWTGAGYIIYDPVNGAGVFKISGGKNGSYSDTGDMAIALGVLSGSGNAYAKQLVGDDLPFSEDLPRIRLAKTIARAAGALGVVAEVLNIFSALDGLSDGTIQPSQILGRLSVIVFGYAIGSVVAGVAATVFFPVAAAVMAAIFIAALSLLLTEFSALYFSYYLRDKKYLAA